jgi:methyl-accepting chemotaxis protein
MPDLQTTNWLIGVIAVSSAIQSLFLIGAAIAGYRLYRETTKTVSELERQHVEPLRRQVDAILADVHRITARVSDQTERVDNAISGTIDRVDETAERVKDKVRERVSRAAGIVRGVRAIIASLLTTEPAHEPRAEAGGRI